MKIGLDNDTEELKYSGKIYSQTEMLTKFVACVNDFDFSAESRWWITRSSSVDVQALQGHMSWILDNKDRTMSMIRIMNWSIVHGNNMAKVPVKEMIAAIKATKITNVKASLKGRLTISRIDQYFPWVKLIIQSVALHHKPVGFTINSVDIEDSFILSPNGWMCLTASEYTIWKTYAAEAFKDLKGGVRKDKPVDFIASADRRWADHQRILFEWRSTINKIREGTNLPPMKFTETDGV